MPPRRRNNEGLAVTCDDVLDFVISRGQDGTTYDEIDEHFADEAARARCVELKNAGLVIDVPGSTRTTRKGRQAQVMIAVRNADRAAIEKSGSRVELHQRVEKMNDQETKFLSAMVNYCNRAADPGMVSALGPMQALGLDVSSLSFGSTFQALLAVLEWANQQNLELEQHTHAAYDARDMLWAMLADLEHVARYETDSTKLRKLVQLISSRRRLVCELPDELVEAAGQKAASLKPTEAPKATSKPSGTRSSTRT